MKTVKAIIEIPQGDNRRRHLAFDKSGFVDLGPIIIPFNNGKMPAHYGFIPGTQNPSDDDALDIIVISDAPAAVGEELDVRPICVLRRHDGDDKIVAVLPDSVHSGWDDIDLELRELLLAYMGHNSAITGIGTSARAHALIEAHTIT